MNNSATMMSMNDYEILFHATAWELDTNDCIWYDGNAFLINEIKEVDGGYMVQVTEQKWQEDEELFLLDDEIIPVIRPEESY